MSMYSLVYKNKKFVAGVIGIVSLAFLLWLLWVGGVKDIANIGQNCVAKVDGSCITLRDYRRELLRYGNLAQNKDMERLIKQQVLESLIVQELLYTKAKKLGFLASDQEVIDLIKSDPSFQENGIFSTSKYEESLARLGLEPTEYEEYIRKILTIQKLLNLIGNAVYLTPREEEINLLSQSFEISGRLYIINPEDVPVSVSEKEILDFYTQNRENFKREPTKVVRLWIEKDKQKAEEIYRALRNRQEVPNFKEFKLPQQEGEFPAELKGELNRLSPTDPISLVKTGEGYAIVFLFKEETGGYKSLEEVKAQIEKTLKEKKAQEQVKSLAERVKEDLKQGKDVPYRFFEFSKTPALQLLSVMKLGEKDLFEILLSKEKVFGPYPLLKGYGVLVVQERSKKEMDQKQRAEFIKDLISLKKDATINYYIESLRKGAKVKINRELIGG
ncbi:peptidylprolyl isomerase [Thermocrinis sp.]|uniref:peptidylprolyl isomerase n=1 Tax=Thermocrinis sp. TaxID=2024383 RepID=UPI002615DE74|nr:peptidylprolyl isomerase [Thermocrinis sp.]